MNDQCNDENNAVDEDMGLMDDPLRVKRKLSEGAMIKVRKALGEKEEMRGAKRPPWPLSVYTEEQDQERDPT